MFQIRRFIAQPDNISGTTEGRVLLEHSFEADSEETKDVDEEEEEEEEELQ